MEAEQCPRVLPSDRCGDPARLEAALHRLEALAVVSAVSAVRIDEKHNHGAGRVTVNLWCSGTHDRKDVEPRFERANAHIVCRSGSG